ncbi:hypothetical protein [Streptomyces globosus]|uniref:hypothetical protein n=1 Tax=Streptomyces globosus TaxID=68209 RepID=UPI0031DAA33A
MQATSPAILPASGELDIFDADQRRRIPAAAGIAATTPAASLSNPGLIKAYRRSDLPPLTPRAIAVLIEIAEMKEGQDANFVRFLDYVAGLIWQAGDSKAVLAEVLNLIDTAEAGE